MHCSARVGAERLEPGAGVAVTEVDLALGEQVVDAADGLVLGQPGEVVVVHQEEVGRVALRPLALRSAAMASSWVG